MRAVRLLYVVWVALGRVQRARGRGVIESDVNWHHLCFDGFKVVVAAKVLVEGGVIVVVLGVLMSVVVVVL